MSMGSGEDAAYAMAVVAVIAIMASSMIAVGLAAGGPIDEGSVASSVDKVNRLNDAIRQRTAECVRRHQLNQGGAS